MGELRRELGLLDAVGIGLGAIIGAGIFVVTGLAASVAGSWLLLSLVIAGAAAAANALSSAQLAARYPQSGGTYEYGWQLLGPRAGFVAGCCFLISKIAAAGTVALGLGAYIDRLLPGISPRVAAPAAVILFTVLNYFGVRRSSRVNLVIVALSVSSLVLYASLLNIRFDTAQFTASPWPGSSAMLHAAALLFFAYTGYARVATLGEEVRTPEVTIPRAVLITIAAAIVLYVAVVVSALGAAGPASLAGSPAPLHDAATAAGSPAAATLAAIGALVAMLGVILSQVLGLSRMVFAMARRGDLPAALHHVHPRFGSPSRAVLAVGIAATLVAAWGTLQAVATAASCAILIYYGITNAAALRLPAADRLYPRFVPAFGLAACATLALALPPSTVLFTLGLLAVAILIRAARSAALRRPRGP